MFTLSHCIWIGICAVLIAVLTYVSVRFKFTFKIAAMIMAGIALCSEVSKILSHMELVNGVDASEGMILAPDALLLHLCSLMIFVYFYLPFCKNEKRKSYLISFMVPLSFIGAPLAILMATSGSDFVSPEPYQCFLYHAGMIWFALYVIITKQVDMGKRAYLRNLAILFCLAIIMLWVNGVLSVYDTNFFYLVRPPADTLPLLNLDNGWFAYFGTIAACGIIGVTVVHLPFVIKEKCK